VLLCEGGGYDVVLVETVGLGQSEVVVDTCVDMLLLVVPPAGGDELQGVKKGIVEVADAIVVNKADGALEPAARHAAAEYQRALQLVRWKHHAWQPRVMRASAATGVGVTDVWAVAAEFRRVMGSAGLLLARRQAQATEWMWHTLEAELVAMARGDAAVQTEASRLQRLLASGYVTPRRAAHKLLDTLLADVCEDANARRAALSRAVNGAGTHAPGAGDGV
jgi:LAO/AO transport system kinase